MIRLHDLFGDMCLVRRGQPIPRGERIPTSVALLEIERAFRDPTARRQLIAAGANGSSTERALRSGELVAIRTMRKRVVQAMRAGSSNASSCGMFIRSLYKMIGVRDVCLENGKIRDRYAKRYVFGDAIKTELEIARKVGALVTRGDKDANGVLKTPDIGDAVYVAESGNEGNQHFFVIVGKRHQPIVRKSGGVERSVDGYLYTVAQGGQGKRDYLFPDDGTCMATNIRTTDLYLDNWLMSRGRLVRSWIDIDLLAAACDDGFIVKPVRKAYF
jgi:hypothetical protein